MVKNKYNDSNQKSDRKIPLKGNFMDISAEENDYSLELEKFFGAGEK
jgi:hypothetical protein